ncbi:MAG: 16S rRNA (cytosine(1402)-N(4))-methyltransferase, partial [Planctomycetaceae bacterium]
LQTAPQHTVLDGTVGAGGHSLQILQRLGPEGRLIGIDRDPLMLRHAAARLDDPRVTLVNSSYADAQQILQELRRRMLKKMSSQTNWDVFSAACQLTCGGWIESQKRSVACSRCQSAGQDLVRS